MIDEGSPIPWVLAGPILRQCAPTPLVCWLAVREPARLRIRIDPDEGASHEQVVVPGAPGCRMLTAGTHLHYLLIDLRFDTPLPQDCWIGYTVAVQSLTAVDDAWFECADLAPELCYPGKQSPGFVLPSRIHSLLHGSCRKPHHAGGDGLVAADRLLERLLAQKVLPREGASPSETPDALPTWPSVLMMTGDQVYADDVAGPMLHAIHQVIARLGLPDEPLAGGELSGADSAQALYCHPAGFYHRETLLPRYACNYALIEMLFGGVEKPVFTTDSAHNHLISLDEVLAMYLLVWSPALWSQIDLTPPAHLDADSLKLYNTERDVIEAFAAGLPAVRRLFAHLPTAMIFDDHDITDDWNLSREWERGGLRSSVLTKGDWKRRGRLPDQLGLGQSAGRFRCTTAGSGSAQSRHAQGGSMGYGWIRRNSPRAVTRLRRGPMLRRHGAGVRATPRTRWSTPAGRRNPVHWHPSRIPAAPEPVPAARYHGEFLQNKDIYLYRSLSLQLLITATTTDSRGAPTISR